MFTLKFLKQHFPIFNLKQSTNKYFTYLDSAATAQKPKFVVDSLSIFFKKYYSNINRGLYKISGLSNNVYERSRASVASFIKAKSYKNIVFTENSTGSLNLVQRSFMLEKRFNGKRLMLSVYEHHSNIIPWKLLSICTKSIITYVSITKSGFLSFKQFIRNLSKRTVLSALSSCSNTLGLINKVRKFTSILNNLGIVSVVDGSQSILHNRVNLSLLNCDFYVFSGHKMLSPCGIGILYLNNRWFNYLIPTRFGGGVTYNLNLKYKVVLKEIPHLFEGGTPNLNGACGLLACINYLNFLNHSVLRLNTFKLNFLLKKLICNLNTGNLVFIPTLKSIYLFIKNPVFLFINNKHPHDVSHGLDLSDLAVRSGYQCNQPLIEAGLKVHSVSRLSHCVYNNFNCIKRFALTLSECSF